MEKKIRSNYGEAFGELFSIRRKETHETERKTFHSHKQYEIVYALSNNLICKTELGSVDIPSGCCILLNQSYVHHIDHIPDSGICDRYVFYFDSAFVAMFLPIYGMLLSAFQHAPNQLPPIVVIDADKRVQFEQLLAFTEEAYNREKKLRHEARTKIDERERLSFSVRLSLGMLLVIVDQCYQEQYTQRKQAIHKQSHSDIAWSIQEYINSHCGERLTIDKISKNFYISRSLINKVYQETYHQTFAKGVRERRANKAQELLMNTDMQIDQIAQAVGYGSNSAFTRAFTVTAGMTPLQFRKSAQFAKKIVLNDMNQTYCPYRNKIEIKDNIPSLCPNFASCGCRFRHGKQVWPSR